MNKKIKTIALNKEDICNASYSLEEFCQKINAAKEKGATDIMFHNEEDYAYAQFYYEREETDEEYTERLAKEELWKKSQYERDIRELERLKKKLNL